jgi:CheY-like chemotaxis protein
VSEALAILDDHRPDVAILDVNLAGEEGYVVAERLQAGNVPFIFATGYGGKGIPDRWSRSPVLQKPFRVDAIAGALRTALGR